MSRRFAWRPPSLSPAGWMAATGASLLLVAAAIVVVSRWNSIGPEIRFSGLVAALIAAYFVAEAGRDRLPTTATAIATLAATMTAPTAVAAAATLEQPWPVCTLIGGMSALVATEIQSRRWRVPVLEAATVVAFGLAAVGAAALISVPVAAIGALGAAGALLAGSTRRALAVAIAVGATPLLTGLADSGLGAGTLERLGVTDPEAVWWNLAASVTAACVTAVVAHRRSNVPLGALSLGVLGSGVVAALLAQPVDAIVWWTLPPLVLLACEGSGAATLDSIWRRIARSASPVVGFPVGAAALMTPFVAIADREDAYRDAVTSRWWCVPLLLAGCALIATAAGTAERADGARWQPAALLATAAATFAAVVAFGAPLWLAAVVAVGAWGAISAMTRWNVWDLTTACIGSWILIAALADDTSATWLRLAFVCAAGVMTVVASASVERSGTGLRLIATSCIVGATSAAIGSSQPLAVGTVVLIGLIAFGVALRPDRATWPLVFASGVSWLAIDIYAPRWPDITMIAVLALAFGLGSRRGHPARLHVAAALGAIVGGLAMLDAGVDATSVALSCAVVGLAFTGIAIADQRLDVARSAGLGATTLAVLVGADADPDVVSLLVALLGIQVAVAGERWKGSVGSVPGITLSCTAIMSLWWTTGANTWVVDAIAPYGASGADLAIGTAAVALIGLGVALRRSATRSHSSVSSWLAYGPGLGMAGTWLVSTQLESGTTWATVGALLVGVVGVAVGGVRRLAAPLVLGTATIVGTLVVSAGPRLSEAPTWVWIAVGGVGLLVLAALVERSDRPLLTAGRKCTERESLAESFCERFE